MAGSRKDFFLPPFRASCSQLSCILVHITFPPSLFSPALSLSPSTTTHVILEPSNMASRDAHSRTRESTTNRSNMSQHKSHNSESTRITLGQRSNKNDTSRMSHHFPSMNTRSYASMDATARSSHSTKTTDLSQRVTGLEKGLTSMNGKLERLIALQTTDRSTSTPRRDVSAQPVPRYLDFEHELKKGDPDFTTKRGKEMVKEFYVDNPIPRPYMFLDIPGLHSLKDKATYRDKMTYQDYILAFTNMLRDHRACSQEDWPHLIEHLNQVACDATTRPWRDVRAWSEHVFTKIETGDFNWASTAEIQYARMRISIAPSSQAPQNPPTSINNQSAKSITCPDFSAKRCRSRGSHTEAGVMYLHNCAWCSAALNLKNTTHNVIDCDNKLGRPQERLQRPPQQYLQQQQPRQYQGPQNHQQQQPTQQQPRRQVVTSAVIQNPLLPLNPKNDQ